ncbi:uncharacterized protein [Macrobrachium rosenbergii]|uniref:uncharacterized protein n=1 Tax=Macrobrachium rosenbergii TaxID=79674 RepID=UPI0034D54723
MDSTASEELGTTAKGSLTSSNEDEKAIEKLEKKASELKGMVTAKRKKLSILKKAARILSGLTALLARNRLKRDSPSVSLFELKRPFFIDLSGPDNVRITPYCDINQENALKGTPAFLLLKMMNDIMFIAEGPTEQFDCLVAMLEEFQNLLGNEILYIPSSANSEIREAIRNVNSSVQNLNESAKSALKNMETELSNISKDFEEKGNIDTLTNKAAFIT